MAVAAAKNAATTAAKTDAKRQLLSMSRTSTVQR
jgi:hypothetical protein